MQRSEETRREALGMVRASHLDQPSLDLWKGVRAILCFFFVVTPDSVDRKGRRILPYTEVDGLRWVKVTDGVRRGACGCLSLSRFFVMCVLLMVYLHTVISLFFSSQL